MEHCVDRVIGVQYCRLRGVRVEYCGGGIMSGEQSTIGVCVSSFGISVRE